MTGTNTGWSGGITIKSGTVSQGTNAASLGTGMITLGDSSGSSNATLMIATALTVANPITVAAGSSGTLRITVAPSLAASSYTGAVTLNNQLTLGNLGASGANTLTIGGGGITGSSDIVVDSAGNPVVIAGTNNATWTGNLIVKAGTAQLGGNAAVPGVVSVGSGATFDFLNNTAAAVRGIQDYSGAGGTVTTTNSRALTVNGNGSYSFSGNITGANMGFTVALGSSGVQTLSGSNSYGGATTINSGILNIRNDSALGTTVGSTSVALGATLQLEGGITVGNETLTINGLGAAGQNGVLVNVSGINSYGGQLTMGSNTGGTAISSDSSGTLNLTNTGTITNANSRTLILTGSGSGSLAGVLAASGAITKNGTGTWTLTGTNTYSGATTISAGTLQIGNGGTTGTLSSTSAIVNNANLTINRSNAVAQGTDFSTAAITGTGSFTQAGTGTTTLNATNSYTGVTTVERGTLSFTSGAASATANQALGANATLILGVASTSSGTLNYTGAAGTLAKNVNVLGNGLDTIQNSGTGLLTLSGTLTKNGTILILKGGSNGINVTGAIAGSGANSDLIVDGGMVTLSSANTYNGLTSIINGATLNASVANALPMTNGRTAVYMDQTVAGAATGTGSSILTLGSNQSVSLLSGQASSKVNLNARTLTIGSTSGTANFAGVISGANGALIKDSASTQTLSGSNTYTGSTTVNAGTLTAAATNALGNSTVINVNGGSFLVTAENAVNDNAAINLGGGRMAVSGTFNETVGALTLSANSTIDFSGFVGTLRFSGVGSWASGANLAIWNWSGTTQSGTQINNYATPSNLVFTNNSTLTSNLANISFYSDSGNSFVGNGFEVNGFSGGGSQIIGDGSQIIPVPETETYFYAVALLAGLVIQYIRRRAKRKVCRLRLTSDPRLNRSATTVAVTITADAHPLA